jgi:hypothetical protein
MVLIFSCSLTRSCKVRAFIEIDDDGPNFFSAGAAAMSLMVLSPPELQDATDMSFGLCR